jgi:hypothetical protein
LPLQKQERNVEEEVAVVAMTGVTMILEAMMASLEGMTMATAISVARVMKVMEVPLTTAWVAG